MLKYLRGEPLNALVQKEIFVMSKLYFEIFPYITNKKFKKKMPSSKTI